MGNRITCCRQRWSPLDDSVEELSVIAFGSSNFSYQNTGAVFYKEEFKQNVEKGPNSIHCSIPNSSYSIPVLSGVTQHICEREPDDPEFDPSLNASQRALFIKASSSFRQASNLNEFSVEKCSFTSNFENDTQGMKKWSSCSTVYIGDGCLVHPHQETTLWSIAFAIEILAQSPKINEFSGISTKGKPWDYICDADSKSEFTSNDGLHDLYDERKHAIMRRSSDNSVVIPEPDFTNNPKASNVHGFLVGLYSTALLSPQCAIVALIFLERLINAAEVQLLPWSWRRQLLSCLILASKLLDDQAVWNTDYCQVLRDLSVDDLNALERHTLSLLQFNVDIPPAVYARYYFDLLSVGEAHGVANQPSERRRLTPELARNMRILTSGPESRSPGSSAFDTRLLFDLARTDEPLPALCSTPPKVDATVKNSPTRKERTESVAAKHLTDELSSSKTAQFGQIAPTPNNFQPQDWISNISVDEGPLELDDETEYINSLTDPSIFISPLQQSVTSTTANHIAFDNPLCPQSISPIQLHPNLNPPSGTLITDQHFSSQCARSTQSTNPATTNQLLNHGTGFIRSIMGGEVAYSLLRDAGMY